MMKSSQFNLLSKSSISMMKCYNTDLDQTENFSSPSHLYVYNIYILKICNNYRGRVLSIRNIFFIDIDCGNRNQHCMVFHALSNLHIMCHCLQKIYYKNLQAQAVTAK